MDTLVVRKDEHHVRFSEEREIQTTLESRIFGELISVVLHCGSKRPGGRPKKEKTNTLRRLNRRRGRGAQSDFTRRRKRYRGW